jgi:hypothetical protein
MQPSWGGSTRTHDLGELHSFSYPFVYGVKVFLFVKVVTPTYNTLILFLSMDPSLLYSSHFDHLLSKMIMHMFTQFHISQGSVTVL